MTLILNGTDGLSDVDGTAATPAIRGTDANTGIFFPAADTIAFSEGGVESMRIDGAGNLGIGTASPGSKLEVSANNPFVTIYNTNTGDNGITWESDIASGESRASLFLNYNNAELRTTVGVGGNNYIQTFYTNGSERMRIDSAGNLILGATSSSALAFLQNGAKTSRNLDISATHTTAYGAVGFNNGNGTVGSISLLSNSVAYNTTSDYRLKENIAPMTGALATVSALKPVTYKWKSDGSDGQGFIAHELQAVVPDCVTGEKDAVDSEGNPQYQGIDTSFLVATLTAAIQELKATVDAQAARIAALESVGSA
jgi:hypothetical protein